MDIYNALLRAALGNAPHEMEVAYSMACSMLEGLLDPDPVVAEAARLAYLKRLADKDMG